MAGVREAMGRETRNPAQLPEQSSRTEEVTEIPR